MLIIGCLFSAPVFGQEPTEPSSAQTQRPLMRDVFASMPDSIAPLVTKNNRLDCIDFIENNMEARVRNVLDDYVTLEALTPDYARFRTSTSAFLELKLLPASDSTSVLCLLRTAQSGEVNTARRMEDTTIRFFHPDWTPIDSDSLFALPPVPAFLLPPSDGSALPASYDQALRSLESFHPVHLFFSAEDGTLTANLQLAYLATDEREAVAPYLRPLQFRWNHSAFRLP